MPILTLPPFDMPIVTFPPAWGPPTESAAPTDASDDASDAPTTDDENDERKHH